jgi:16S rRNA (guanine1516-N2)-methyltransferase
MRIRIAAADWGRFDAHAQDLLAPLRDDAAPVGLIHDDEGWGLVFDAEPRWKPFRIDFNEASRVARLEGQGREFLKKALGSGAALRILDATAGLCRDSLLLASWGHQVSAYERDPLIYVLAREAARRWESPLPGWSLSFGDAREALATLRPQVAYLDPMYPHDEARSAAPKKELRALQLWHGTAGGGRVDDGAGLFGAAWEHVQSRVIVKRPLKGAPLVPTPAPTHVIKGVSSRFDVYVKS